MAVYNSILNPSRNVKDRTPDHNTRNYVPYSCEQCVGSLTSHKVIMNKGCETGPTIYHPYPRRLDSLTICRYHYKGSTFCSPLFMKTIDAITHGRVQIAGITHCFLLFNKRIC